MSSSSRHFNSSKGTNLAILIILAPRSRCSLCKKCCKLSNKVIECTDCEKRFHAKCSNLGAVDLLKVEIVTGIAQTARLIAACAVMLFSVFTRQISATVARCGFTMNTHSQQRLNMKMYWNLVVLGFVQNANFSTFRTLSLLTNWMNRKRFDPLTKKKNDWISSNRTNQTNFSWWIEIH